jgi:glutaredoxin
LQPRSGDSAPGAESLGPESAKRLFYQYIDDNDAVHFVERLDLVPPAWRERVGFVEMDGPPPASRDAAQRMRERNNAGSAGGIVLASSPSSARGPDVTLYWADWCGYCKKARADLKRRGTSYDLRDIDNPAALAELVDKTGQRGIPVLDVDGKILIGYDPEGMDRLLGPAS